MEASVSERRAVSANYCSGPSRIVSVSGSPFGATAFASIAARAASLGGPGISLATNAALAPGAAGARLAADEIGRAHV